MNSGYKIVTNNLQSLMCDCLRQYTIQYKIGEWVKAWPGTPLLYFENLHDTKKFMHENSSICRGCSIYKIQARFPFKNTYYWDIWHINSYIEANKKHKKYIPVDYHVFPIGTKMCKEIKLLEVVE